jgi:hypothetical protein
MQLLHNIFIKYKIFKSATFTSFLLLQLSDMRKANFIMSIIWKAETVNSILK